MNNNKIINGFQINAIIFHICAILSMIMFQIFLGGYYFVITFLYSMAILSYILGEEK